MSRAFTLLLIALGLLLSLGSLSSGDAGPLLVTLAGAGACFISVGLGFGLALLGAGRAPLGARLLRRSVELMGALPTLISALLLLMWSPKLLTLLALVSVVRGVRIARSMTGELRRLSRQPFVEASRALGAPLSRQVQRDLLPFAGPLLAAEAASGVLWTVALVVGLGLANVPLPGLGHALTLTGGARTLWLLGAFVLSLGLLRVLLGASSPSRDSSSSRRSALGR